MIDNGVIHTESPHYENSIFGKGHNWYRGNLHMHTNKSDGLRSEFSALRTYQQKGYDFVALTDHRIVAHNGWFKNMLVLSGVEYDLIYRDACWHILGIGCIGHHVDKDYDPKVITPMEVMKAIRADGGIPVIAHPAWSRMNPNDLAYVEGPYFTEAYNSVSGVPYNGNFKDSSLYLDMWGGMDYNVVAFGSDDTHRYDKDLFGAQTFVRADECSFNNIRDNLYQGNCYATTGPYIFDVTRDGVTFTAYVDARAKHVIFNTAKIYDENRCQSYNENGNKYTVTPEDKYIRIEVINEDGTKATTNVIQL